MYALNIEPDSANEADCKRCPVRAMKLLRQAVQDVAAIKGYRRLLHSPKRRQWMQATRTADENAVHGGARRESSREGRRRSHAGGILACLPSHVGRPT